MEFKHKPIIVQDITAEMKRGMRYYTCGDNEYPSITSVLGSEPKPYLEEWKQRKGAKAAAEEATRCADRGTNVHEMCETFLNNEEITKEYPKEHIKMFNKIKLALYKINNIYIQEAGLYSDVLRIAGRVDCIAEFNGVPSVIDFKTSNYSRTEETCFDYFLQKTFYSLALLEQTDIDIPQIVTIISVERHAAPQVFVRNREDFVRPLVKRINQYYKRIESP
jgi:genome maintenance exonuclease 1